MAKKVKLKPINDRIWVERYSEEGYEKSASGLYLGVQANQDVSFGKVIKVGSGRIVDGKLIPFTVKEGDEIAFGKRAVIEFAKGGENHVLVREADIISVIEYEDE